MIGTETGEGRLQGPLGLAVTADGGVAVIDSETKRLKVYIRHTTNP